LGERRPPARGNDRGGRTEREAVRVAAALIDLAPTLVAALDAPTAITPKGRILHEVVGGEKALTARESTVQIPGMGESAVSHTEADEMEEHLRGLGYIE
jgi:hypothetical protein